MKNKKIIIIAGPTATGKTKVSIDLAKKHEAEIVNFDSLLFYKELTIGSAKPTMSEMENIPHHLVSTNSILEPMNAADYVKVAIPVVEEILERKKVVILVGGSGFYLQAFLHGMYESITTSSEVKKKSDDLYRSEGILPFRNILQSSDIVSYQRYHENDHYRIRRSVEHFWMTGLPFSEARDNKDKKLKESNIEKYHWDIFFGYLDIPKEEHFKIIKKRTDQMLNDGLILEVKELLKSGFTGKEKPLKSIGYKETIDYIKGLFQDLDEFKERLSINTRRLAKSQRTWFKKIEKNEYHSIEDRAKLNQDIEIFLKGH